MALAKFKKSKIFKGRLFSNIVRIKLFTVDTQCCIPLDLNKMAVNVHLFKQIGILNIDNVILKEKMDLGCLRDRLDRCLCIPK